MSPSRLKTSKDTFRLNLISVASSQLTIIGETGENRIRNDDAGILRGYTASAAPHTNSLATNCGLNGKKSDLAKEGALPGHTVVSTARLTPTLVLE